MIKRSSGLLVFECNLGNPNGDPDWEGEPRVTSDGYGWASDCSLKRKLRDLFVDHKSPVFQYLQERLEINPDRFHVFESMLRGFKDASDGVEAKKLASKLSEDIEAFCNWYWDVRLFGTTAIQGKKEEKEFDFIATGPVVLSNAISVAKVNKLDGGTLSKRFPLRQEESDLAPRAKKYITHGVYVSRISVNPNLATRTFTTQEDVEVFKHVLKHIFTSSTSTSRPPGSLNVLHTWWADHTNPLGSFDERKFWESLTPVRIGDDPTMASHSLEDYTFSQPDFDFPVEDLNQFEGFRAK